MPDPLVEIQLSLSQSVKKKKKTLKMLTWLCLNSQKPATQQILLSIIAALKLLFWTWYQSEKVTQPDKNILCDSTFISLLLS